MEYRNLGRTGVKVSQLCLGTMMFGRRTNERDSIAIIEHALDHGVNFIDTANAYSPGAQRADRRQGAREERQARHDVLATKGFFPQDANDPNGRGLSRRHIIDACDASLERLGTDWIDLYQLHRAAVRDPDRRDAARARRPDPRRQGALHRHEHVRRLEDRRGALGREGARPEPLRLRADGVSPARPHRRARGDSGGADVRHRASSRGRRCVAVF